MCADSLLTGLFPRSRLRTLPEISCKFKCSSMMRREMFNSFDLWGYDVIQSYLLSKAYLSSWFANFQLSSETVCLHFYVIRTALSLNQPNLTKLAAEKAKLENTSLCFVRKWILKRERDADQRVGWVAAGGAEATPTVIMSEMAAVDSALPAAPLFVFFTFKTNHPLNLFGSDCNCKATRGWKTFALTEFVWQQSSASPQLAGPFTEPRKLLLATSALHFVSDFGAHC